MMMSRANVHCLRCGYDLSHTAHNHACPECGLAAERSLTASLHPDDARPRWVWSIAVATVLLLVSYVTAISAAALMLPPIQDWSPNYRFNLEFPEATRPCTLLFLAAVAHVLANLYLSRDDRKRPITSRRRLFLWCLRLAPVAPLLGASIILAIAVFYAVTSNTLYTMPAALTMAADYLGLFAIVCPTLTFFRLRWLAQRLSRRRLAEHIGIVATGSGITLMIWIFVSLPATEFIRHADVWFYSLVALPLALFWLFTLSSFLLLFVICLLFHRSARHAKQKWINADAARGILPA